MGLFILLVSYVREQLWTAGLHLASLRWSWTVLRMQTHTFTGVLGQNTADKQVCSSTDITRSPALLQCRFSCSGGSYPPTYTYCNVSANSHLCPPTHIHTLFTHRHTCNHKANENRVSRYSNNDPLPCPDVWAALVVFWYTAESSRLSAAEIFSLCNITHFQVTGGKYEHLQPF